MSNEELSKFGLPLKTPQTVSVPPVTDSAQAHAETPLPTEESAEVTQWDSEDTSVAEERWENEGAPPLVESETSPLDFFENVEQTPNESDEQAPTQWQPVGEQTSTSDDTVTTETDAKKRKVSPLLLVLLLVIVIGAGAAYYFFIMPTMETSDTAYRVATDYVSGFLS